MCMKCFIKNLLFLSVVAVLAACENGGGSLNPPVGDSADVFYVLNSGDWGAANSSLTKYDLVTGAAVQNYFELQNGRRLGDTANDMIVYGSKIYIAVSGESTIEVTSLNAKSVKQIECAGQPRYLAAHAGKVYATYYNGNVACIDTVTLEVDAMVGVGRNPEQLAVYNNRLYVANSGGMDYNTELGYDSTVFVIDLPSFTVFEKIDVVCNPAVVVAGDNGVYVASYGNYADVPSTLQCISADGTVAVVEECSNMTEFCYSFGSLYGFFSSYDIYWNATITYLSYNLADQSVDTPWIKEDFLPAPYKVCASGEYICVTSSDYINDGDTYLYDTDGMCVCKVPSGLNPIKVVAVK